MADWLASMEQTFEFYRVDPNTWGDIELLNNVKNCTISRDSSAETLGSATLSVTESVGECYLRIYLITIQNGIKERHPLGTFLVQTPSSNYTGMLREVTMDAYTPLIELKENPPPIGFTVLKGDNILVRASALADENMRAPVVRVTRILDADGKPTSSKVNETLKNDFVSSTSDTWMTFLRALIKNADHTFALDEMGRVMFAPKQDVTSMRPAWTFNDDNSSILYPDISLYHDMFDIPNAVEVVASTSMGSRHYIYMNEDPNSPASIQNRGRKITYRQVDPDLNNGAWSDDVQLRDYAKRLLKALSTVEYTVTFTHGYCPVRLGDCVRLDYSRAGLSNIKAKVISQSIKCEPGCPVTTKAVFTAELWG